MFHPPLADGLEGILNDPAHNALETEFTYYGSPVKRDLLKPVIDPKVFSNTDVFPEESTLEKLEANSVSAKGTQLRDRIWTEFKAA